MSHLHAELSQRVKEWRDEGFPHDEFPAIVELLEHQMIDGDDDDLVQSRFLRAAQFDSLCTYWYLRLVLGTLHVRDLYQKLFPRRSELISAFGLSRHEGVTKYLMDYEVNEFFDAVANDDEFVEENKLQNLRETLALDYPSYILALTMGAGKTVLIGSIIATEFCMALEYPDGPFVQNALVFAPGKTILGSLRQIASMPFELILPDRFFKFFSATVKLIFSVNSIRKTKHSNPLASSRWQYPIFNPCLFRSSKSSLMAGSTPQKKSPKPSQTISIFRKMIERNYCQAVNNAGTTTELVGLALT